MANDQQQQQQQQQNQGQGWITGLSQEHQDLAKVKGWKTPAEVIAGYSDLEKLVGVDHVRMPDKDANGNYDLKGVGDILGRLGTPKEATGYQMPQITIDEGVPLTVQQLEAFKPIAHKYGLLPHQFQGIMTEFSALLNQGLQITKKKAIDDQNALELALRQEVGADYPNKKALAERTLASIVDQARAKRLKEKYGNDPDFQKLLMNMGDNMSEEQFRSTELISGIQSPAAAQAEIDKIRKDKTGPYWIQGHPEHQAAVDKVAQLNELIVKLSQRG